MSKVVKSEEQWRQDLTPEQYQILRRKGTERPFTGEYEKYKGDGVFICAGCGQALFDATTKYNSGSGWPSFYQPIEDKAVDEHSDQTLGMTRVEVTCSNCGGHLGHVFPDGPRPTGQRYCINSLSLKLDPKKD
ncbi:MAG: peptide-methionine (R)-S-oxide reductase [Alphaproteobacteria bacterium]|nr:peptide-methionine (R)-S-oxide reductase [Alphaproteobacteria bacterium]PHX98460.1 MAG: peptide-methionine (R)-S-oxide reductase [Rhodospirillaceae bacterium]